MKTNFEGSLLLLVRTAKRYWFTRMSRTHSMGDLDFSKGERLEAFVD